MPPFKSPLSVTGGEGGGEKKKNTERKKKKRTRKGKKIKIKQGEAHKKMPCKPVSSEFGLSAMLLDCRAAVRGEA